MGQAYLIANLGKREYIYPHDFGDGYKLLEFADSAGGIMTALAILLASGNGTGSGDLDSDNPIIGSWAGDRIVVAGQYADGKLFVEGVAEEELQEIANKVYTKGYNQPGRVALYQYALEKFTNVSMQIKQAMAEDERLREELERREGHFGMGEMS